MQKTLRILPLVAFCATATAAAAPPAKDNAAHKAHEEYVAAINSNNLDTLLGMLTEDVVYMAAHEAPMVGKAAVKPWVDGYFKAFKTHWEKPVQEFVVINGEWAFERYSYKSTDTPVGGGGAVSDTGWGLAIYHHDKDGKWRVARDSWGPDHPATAAADAMGGAMDADKVKDFATRYTSAWCSQDPTRVASFYSEKGSLKINAGEPAVGHAAITASAQGFMRAFPDMVVAMDSVGIENGQMTFRWTLTGTNTGPGGTGKAVRMSGYEEWTLGADGLIAQSLGHYDEADYARQLGR